MHLAHETCPLGRVPLFQKLVSNTRGLALVEFAFVAPILVMLLLGTFWMGRTMSVYQALGRAAREGARAAIAKPCATCGGAGASESAVYDVVEDALESASIDTTNPKFKVDVAWNQPMNSNDPANFQSSGVTVTVSYPVQLNIPFTKQKATTIHLSSTVSMRQEF
jgi:Flp pilus assembly protein TadG